MYFVWLLYVVRFRFDHAEQKTADFYSNSVGSVGTATLLSKHLIQK